MHADCCTDYAAYQAVVLFLKKEQGVQTRVDSNLRWSPSHLILSDFFFIPFFGTLKSVEHG